MKKDKLPTTNEKKTKNKTCAHYDKYLFVLLLFFCPTFLILYL